MKILKINNKKCVIVAVFITLIVLFAGICYATGISILPKTMTEWIAEQKRIKDEKSGINREKNIYESFYDICYNKATKDEKKQLEVVFNNKSFGIGEWKRDVLIIIGDLPINQPRLTVDDVINIIERDVAYNDLTDQFNEIAGAPDFEGGSGIPRSIYFLDDAHTEAIQLMLNGIMHVVYNEDGTYIIKPIEGTR